MHHDWMMKVYTWIGYPKNVVKIFRTMMEKWQTRLGVSRDGKKEIEDR